MAEVWGFVNPLVAVGLGDRSRASLEGAGGPARLVEWRRCDGSLAGRFLLRGQELLGFQWQAGGNWARRVPQDVYRSVRASWFPEVPDVSTGPVAS